MSAPDKEATSPSPEARAAALQQEIESIRNQLGVAVGELDRRRHRFLDLGGQLRRHTVPLVAIGLALAGIAGGGIALAVARHRRRNAIPARLARLRQAVRRMIARPERVAAQPNAAQRIALAGGTAAASVLAKRLAARAARAAQD